MNGLKGEDEKICGWMELFEILKNRTTRSEVQKSRQLINGNQELVSP